jgi:hypothetical protein
MRLEVDDGKGGKDRVSKKIKIIGEGGPDADGKPGIVISLPKCFIATAAYGSPTAKELNTLRAFRDKVLLQSQFGTAFVEFYYQTSPPIAAFIASHEAARTLVRELLLDPTVAILKRTQSQWDREALTGE